ncbi:hypothetical protein [Brevibacillus choshinensis]|uniref:Uncharacterized protein n=1 Tax=Brevibacillus choshinensis TaxID=54911 RepID=A0ABX7FQR5_BRECH|nr:hypothetical protein [Brevibacillus choshinensis]QRG67345.1 hypothetical protein JNE38_28575 [Brevibacillus choshinensis]
MDFIKMLVYLAHHLNQISGHFFCAMEENLLLLNVPKPDFMLIQSLLHLI